MKYTTKNTLVKGQGYSYNLNNKYDATKLCEKLNNYETRIETLQKTINTEDNLEKLRQQVIALQMDIKQCQHDLDKIKELLK